MILNIFTILILFILIVFSTIQFFNILFRGYAPLISTNKNFIKKILEQNPIAKNSNVYELGCGFAWFLSEAEKKFKDAKYIGVEYSFLVCLLAKIRLLIIKSKIKIIKQNFLKIDLSDADMIYCYLIPDIMKKLSGKIQNECKPGTIIIKIEK